MICCRWRAWHIFIPYPIVYVQGLICLIWFGFHITFMHNWPWSSQRWIPLTKDQLHSALLFPFMLAWTRHWTSPSIKYPTEITETAARISRVQHVIWRPDSKHTDGVYPKFSLNLTITLYDMQPFSVSMPAPISARGIIFSVCPSVLSSLHPCKHYLNDPLHGWLSARPSREISWHLF